MTQKTQNIPSEISDVIPVPVCRLPTLKLLRVKSCSAGRKTGIHSPTQLKSRNIVFWIMVIIGVFSNYQIQFDQLYSRMVDSRLRENDNDGGYNIPLHTLWPV